MIHARPDYQDRIVDLAGEIPDDEPVLLIRGQDVCALAAINAWIVEARHRGAAPDIVDAVIDHRDRVADWQATRAVKVPDLPEVGP